MNWLIYISGWFVGWSFFNITIINKEINSDILSIGKLVLWTMMWVWFCVKFIN